MNQPHRFLLSFLVALTFAAPSYAQDLLAGSVSDGESVASASRGGAVLFTTFPGIAPTPFTIASQSFTDVGFDFQAIGADDFTVTDNGWLIETVEVRGSYFNGAGPAESVNIYILGNSGILPDTTNLAAASIYAAENQSYVDVAAGDFQVALPGGGILLPPGTYWIAVQANMQFLVGGQWGWTESADVANSGNSVGEDSAWFQDSPGFIPNASGGPFTCLDAWDQRVDTCDVTDPMGTPPPERDLAFQLTGVALTPGVSVSPTSITTSESPSSSSFVVVLTAPPVGGNTVTVPIGLPDASEGSVDATSVDFTAANWDIPRAVTVTSVDDAVADGDVMYTLTNGPITSGDAGYDGLAVDDVTVTNLDDESAGFSVSPLNISVSEDALVTATVDVNLNTALAPGESVVLPLSSSDTNVATLNQAMLTFTDADGTSPRSVTVTGVDDDIDGGNTPFTVVTGDPSSGTSAVYDALTAGDVADVVGTRTNDDTAGIIVSPTTASTSEAGTTDSFNVVLNSEPVADVTLALTVSDASEGSLSSASLTFTAANWDTPQTVTITGVDDDIDDGDVAYTVITAPASSADPQYSGFDPVDVDVVNANDTDTTGITLSATSGLVTTEAGGGDSFTVVLDSEPTFDVTIPFNSDDTSEGLIGFTRGSGISLTFTAANWDVPQTVGVQGQDDDIADGDVVFNIVSGDPVSGDANYNNLVAGDVADVQVTNEDDEGPATISVNPTSGLETDESGATDSFDVVLTTEPTADVSIAVSSSDLTEGTVDFSTLVFNAANWDTPQTVTVTGEPDMTIDPDVAYTIVLDPAVSTDTGYDGFDPDDVSVTNLNTDLCGPVVISCRVDGPVNLFGTPFCVVDVYNSQASNDPGDWALLAAGVDLGPTGSTSAPDLACETGVSYLVTPSGGTDVLGTYRIQIVPTLSVWGLIFFGALLALFGMFQMRRRAARIKG